MTLQEKRAFERLRDNGYKLTRSRRAVIQALAGADTPLSIHDLHHEAQAFDHDLGLVTVYRTLEVLTELDLVRPVHLMENCHGFALVSPGHTHHMICQQCNAVCEVEGCDLEAFVAQIARETGFEITGHWLELEGLCPNCRKKKERQEQSSDNSK